MFLQLPVHLSLESAMVKCNTAKDQLVEDTLQILWLLSTVILDTAEMVVHQLPAGLLDLEVNTVQHVEKVYKINMFFLCEKNEFLTNINYTFSSIHYIHLYIIWFDLFNDILFTDLSKCFDKKVFGMTTDISSRFNSLASILMPKILITKH